MIMCFCSWHCCPLCVVLKALPSLYDVAVPSALSYDSLPKATASEQRKVKSDRRTPPSDFQECFQIHRGPPPLRLSTTSFILLTIPQQSMYYIRTLDPFAECLGSLALFMAFAGSIMPLFRPAIQGGSITKNLQPLRFQGRPLVSCDIEPLELGTMSWVLQSPDSCMPMICLPGCARSVSARLCSLVRAACVVGGVPLIAKSSISCHLLPSALQGVTLPPWQKVSVAV